MFPGSDLADLAMMLQNKVPRQLPHEVLVRVLQFIPLSERLSCCALVSTAFAAAAAEATATIDSEGLRSSYVSHLPQWLSKHGHVRVLDITHPQDAGTGTARQLDELPCPNLTDMCLREFEAQLAPSSSKPGVLSTATGLTRLLLDYCTCTDGWEGLDSIAALTNLRFLKLVLDDIPLPAHNGSARSSTSDDWAESKARDGSVFLSSLLQLTSLDLSRNTDDDTLQPLSRLTNLH
jgi:hypothetical protein